MGNEESKQKFVDKFGGRHSDSGRKALLLRGILYLIMVILVGGFASDFPSGDYQNAIMEIVALIPMTISLVLLFKGNYRLSSRIMACAVALIIGALSIVVHEGTASPILCFRNVGYYFLGLSILTLFVSSKRAFYVFSSLDIR